MMKFALALVTAIFLAGTANAQTFPQDDEFTAYRAWSNEGSLSASVRTDGEDAWASLTVKRTTAPAPEAITFSYAFGAYDAMFVDVFRPSFGHDIAPDVRFEVDGMSLRPARATLSPRADGALVLDMTFYDPAEGIASDVRDESCPVIAAIQRSGSVTVGLIPSEGWLPLTTRGSQQALAGIC